MKFQVNSADLKSVLALVKGVVSQKNTLPILDNYLFTLSDGKLKIEATDLETAIETKIDVASEGEGRIAINAKQINEFLNLFDAEIMTFDINIGTCSINITSASGKYKIAGVSAEDFPNKADGENESVYEIPSSVILSGISNTMFATSDENTRPILAGILFEMTSDYFRTVATDSHKLSRYTRTDIKFDSASSFILPAKSASVVKGILIKDLNGTTELTVGDKNVSFNVNGFKITSRVIDGKYPNYCAVIPTTNSKTIEVEKSAIVSRLKRVAFFSNPANNMTVFDVSGDKVALTAENIDYSTSAVETLKATTTGEPIKIGFKSKFLLDIIDTISSDKIIFNMTESTRPCVIVPSDQIENEDILTLIMPMQLY